LKILPEKLTANMKNVRLIAPSHKKKEKTTHYSVKTKNNN
jgi:hypothetical protein